MKWRERILRTIKILEASGSTVHWFTASEPVMAALDEELGGRVKWTIVRLGGVPVERCPEQVPDVLVRYTGGRA